MISVNDFKTGLTISVDNGIWKVIDFQHVKPGKGSAFVRSKLRNLRTGAIQEKTFRAGEKVEQAMIENRRMQYLYADGDNHVFMDNETFDQIELPGDYLKDELNYLKANMEVQVQSYESEVIGVELDKDKPYTLYDTSGGILSYSTKDIDTGEAVAEGFSNKEQQGFIKDNKKLLKESAEKYYSTMIKSLDHEAKVTIETQK